MNKPNKLWAAFVAYFKATFSKEKIVAFFKKKFVTEAFKIIFGSAVFGGFYGWVAKYILENYYDEVGEPIIEAGLRKVGYVYHKVEGKILIKKLVKAQGEGNEDSYDDIVDDILS